MRITPQKLACLLVLFSVLPLHLNAQEDHLSLSVTPLDTATIESQSQVTIDTSIKPMRISKNSYSSDHDVLIYLPMDNYDSNTYNYGSKAIRESDNKISRFDNAVAAKSVNDQLALSAQGKLDSAIEFTGGYFSLGMFNANLNALRNAGYTYSAWIKPSTVSNELTIFSSGPYYRPTTLLKLTSEGLLSYFYSSDDEGVSKVQLTGTTPLKVNQWQHVVAVYDPINHVTNLYLNGVLEATTTEHASIGHQSLGVSLAIGTNSSGKSPFLGLMDEVVVFKRALTANNVSDIYNDQYYRGEVVYKEQALPTSSAADKSYNTIKAMIDETEVGATQVSVWQNNRWHPLQNNQDVIFDMSGRMPLTKLKYKIEFATNTTLKGLQFELSNHDYNKNDNDFSFLFMGDDNGWTGHNAIKNAYQTVPNLKLVFSVPDNGWGSGISYNYKKYANSWLANPLADKRYVPIFSGLGNHDIEVPTDVDYASKVLGENVSTALAGMRNYTEGPFDSYDNGYQDTKLNYSFDYQNTHFLMLNGYFRDKEVETNGKYHDRTDPSGYSPFSHVSEDMLTWIEASLSQTPATHKFLFFHEGAFPPPGQRHHGDSLDNARAPGNNGEDGTRPMRDRFWTLLARYNVTATMMGHNHWPSQSWVADPSGQYAPVYELEPGYLLSTKKYAVVSIKDETATVKYMDNNKQTGVYFQSEDDLIINRTAASQHKPTMKQFHAKAESAYKEISKSNFDLEVGGKIHSAYNDLYFEVRDNDINDEIIFSVDGLPNFMQINRQVNATGVNQFRRISLSTKAALTEDDLGTYPITIKATDGINTVSKEVVLTIHPSLAPTIYGSNIINNATYKQLREVLFTCKDNTVLGTGRIYEAMKVTWNGILVNKDGIDGHQGWRPKTYSPDGQGTLIQGIEFRETKIPPGDYTIETTCGDIYGNKSTPFSVSFTFIDDGTALEDEAPWVDSVFPLPGDVKQLSRIDLSIKSNNNGTNTQRYAMVRETAASVQLTNESGDVITLNVLNSADHAHEMLDYANSNIELSFANLPEGEYRLSVTPKRDDLIAPPQLFNFSVTGKETTPLVAPYAPIDVTITLASKYLAKPTNIEINGNQVTWTASTDPDTSGYYIFKEGKLLALVTEGQHYTDPSTTNDDKPQYEVIAYNAETGKVSGELAFNQADDDLTPPASEQILPDLAPNKTVYVDNSLTADCSDYHVQTRLCDGGNDAAYATLSGAADIAEQGNLVLIRAGVYQETLYPKHSGSARLPITFSAYNDDQVTIENPNGAQLKVLPTGEWSDIAWLKVGFYLWEKAYISIKNITFNEMHSWGRIVKGSHIILDGNTFLNATAPGGRASIKFIDSHHNKVLNNTIDGGNDNLFLLASNYNLIDNNRILSGRHTLWTIKSGNYNVLSNNYFYNDLEKIGEVMDANDPDYGEDEPHFGLTSTNNTKFNVIENNIFAYTPPNKGNIYQGIQYAGQDGIIRNNVFYENTGSGIAITSYQHEATYTTNNRFYNNVFYKNHFGGISISNSMDHSYSGNIIKNSIFYQNDFQDHRGEFLSWIKLNGKAVQVVNRRTEGVKFENNNLFNQKAGENYIISGIYNNDETDRAEIVAPITGLALEYQPLFLGNIEKSPSFIDDQNYDFNLASNSPMIDAGAFLTTISSSGSGYTLPVADSYFFTDNQRINHKRGDTIQLEGSTTTATIISIDHTANTLTIDKSLTWTSGQGLSLAYVGTAPDIGAFEYQH